MTNFEQAICMQVNSQNSKKYNNANFYDTTSYPSNGICDEGLSTSRGAMEQEPLRGADTKPSKQLRLPHVKEKLTDFSKTITAPPNVRETNGGALDDKL